MKRPPRPPGRLPSLAELAAVVQAHPDEFPRPDYATLAKPLLEAATRVPDYEVFVTEVDYEQSPAVAFVLVKPKGRPGRYLHVTLKARTRSEHGAYTAARREAKAWTQDQLALMYEAANPLTVTEQTATIYCPLCRGTLGPRDELERTTDDMHDRIVVCEHCTRAIQLTFGDDYLCVAVRYGGAS